MIIKAIYVFLVFMEIMVITYIMGKWLFRIKMIDKQFHDFLEPLLAPLDYLTKKSIIYVPIIELSPILLLVILIYIENMIYKLL